MDPRPIVQVIALTLAPATGADHEKLRRGLESLAAEDPTIRVTPDADPGPVRVAGVSELHLEIIVDRLKREFEVNASVGPPLILFKEALRGGAVGEVKHREAMDGRHQYAHVRLQVSPREDGAGYFFENHMLGHSIPAAFIKAIERGIDKPRLHGVRSRYPLDDVKVELLDGSYHDVDSSDAAFESAGGEAFGKAVRTAGSMLVEPVMRVEVVTPQEYIEEVTWIFAFRVGRILLQDDHGDWRTVAALVSATQLFGLGSELNRTTLGRARYSMCFAQYEPAPDELDLGEGDLDALVNAPLKPLVPGRNSAIALPEPNDDDSDEDDAIPSRN